MGIWMILFRKDVDIDEAFDFDLKVGIGASSQE